jgi:hypothetical protein
MLENSTILLIRHGEKPGDPCADDVKGGDVHLSPAGQERAQAYVKYFERYAAQPVGSGEPLPVNLDCVFAAANTGSSHRPKETVAPFAAASGRPFNTDIPDADYGDLISLLGGSTYAGSSILVCWHHGKIIDFANSLLRVNGQPPPQLPEASTWPSSYSCSVFGWLLQIRYDANGMLMVPWTRCINEHLMPDDTTDPPELGG